MSDKQLPALTEPPSGSSQFTKKTLVAVGVAAFVVLLAIVLFATTSVRDTVSPGASSSPSTSESPSSSPSSSEEPPASPSNSPGASQSAPPPPTDISEPGTVTSGVTATVTDIESVAGEATGPGEIAGPAVRFAVTVINGTNEAVDLRSTVITVYYGSEDTPALELGEPGGVPLPTEVAANSAVSGTFVFSVPTEERSRVRIMVDYMVAVTPLVFEGSVPAS